MRRMTLILRRKLMVIAVQGVKIRLVSRRGIDQMAFAVLGIASDLR